MSLPRLRGERVALGPTRAELIEEYWRWENNPVTINGYRHNTAALPADFPGPSVFTHISPPPG